MPPVIVDQPWPPDAGEDLRRLDGKSIVCPTTGRALRAHHDQLIIWATLMADSQTPPAPGAPLFPVPLDTGLNEAFLMQQRQAEAWMTAAVFATFRTTGSRLKIGPEVMLAWAAALWVYPNVPGTRNPDPSRTPVWIDIQYGLPLTPPGSVFTKAKPLLGLRALRFNRLTFRIDGARGSFSLDAP